MSPSIRDKVLIIGALGAGVLASIGAYQVTIFFIGHRWGDLPELAGGVTLLCVTALCFRGLHELDRLRREQEAEAAKDHLRRVNGSK